MFDRNGKRIYTGDVVTSPVMDGTVISTNRVTVLVKIRNDDTGFETWANPNDCEVIDETTSPNHEDDIFYAEQVSISGYRTNEQREW